MFTSVETDPYDFFFYCLYKLFDTKKHLILGAFMTFRLQSILGYLIKSPVLSANLFIAFI